MLEHWHEFYVLLGTAAATLVALLFVAASLGTGVLSSDSASNTRTYMSPVALHYTSVFFISILTLVPDNSALLFVALSAASGAIGLVVSLFIAIRVFRHTKDVTDRLGYGLAPMMGYAGIFTAAGLMYAGAALGPDVLATALLLLLFVNIRNAWDLTLAMVRMHNDRKE